MTNADKNNSLSINPDNLTNDHRSMLYMRATAHFVDEQLVYYSTDVFCIEIMQKKKENSREYLSYKKMITSINLYIFNRCDLEKNSKDPKD